LSIGSFDTKKETEFALKHVKSKFARVLLGERGIREKLDAANVLSIPRKIKNQGLTKL